MLDPEAITFNPVTFIQSGNAYAAVDAALTVSGPVQRLKTVNSVTISGEDHNIRKQSVPRIVTDTITTPLRMMTTDARFFTALGGYWSSGYLTLNFIDIDNNNPYDALKFKDVEVAATADNKAGSPVITRTVKMPVANTLRPYNTTVPGSGTYYQAQQLENFKNTVNQTVNSNLAMWAAHNDGRTIDSYLLGGKQSRTIDYVPLNPTNRHRVAANDQPAAGIIVSETTANNKFSIVLGAFEDLPRLYINMAGGPAGSVTNNPPTWSEMYVGQYTKERRQTNSQESSMPLLRKNASDNRKVRPQTVQTLLNVNDEMLVREYSIDVDAGVDEEGKNIVKTVSFAYPATGSYTYFKNSRTGEVAFTNNNPGKNKAEQDQWGSRKTENWKANQWTGNYTWGRSNLQNNGTYTLSGNANTVINGAKGTKLTFQTQKSGAVCTPRQFFWQELVGYSLVKDWSNARYGEPALIDDGLGYPESSKGETLTNNKASSRRTIPFEDENGQRIIVGFDEAYQRSPKYRSNPDRWEPPQPVNDLRALDYPSYLVDAHDPVPVRNPETGELENKYTMSDFLFPKKFITNKDENGDGVVNEDDIIERDALCLYIGYEDQVEWTADYNYTDMIFSIYIAPTVEVIEKDIVNIDPTSKQWWERDETEGLSGKASHAALGVNLQGDIALQEDGQPKSEQEIRQEHYDRFNINPAGDEDILAENVWTMHASGTDDIIDFPRASFEYEPYGIYGEKKRNTGRLDTDNKLVAKFLKLAREEGKTVDGKAVFYYTRGDLVDYMQYFVRDNDENEINKWYDGADWRYLLAEYEFENVVNTGLGIPVDFRPIDERWIDTDENDALRTEHALLTSGDRLDSMIVSREPISVRKLAGDLVGSAVQGVPLINTEGFSAQSGATPESRTLGFIAGEIRADPAIDMMVDGLFPDGTDGGDPDDGVPLRSNVLTFPEIIDDRSTHRTGKVLGFFGDMPFNPEDRAALDAEAKKVVDMCYVDFFNGQIDPTDTSLQRDVYAKQDVQDAYGIKEERHSIGFHRTGKEYDLRVDNAQDRTEIAVLGLKGFNPYRTTQSRFIANELDGTEENPAYSVRANYDADGGAAPTFVFDKPIDGAGALIVNGNLHIKSTFAYYGVLIVLGDIIIEPSLHEDQFVYNANGHAVDAEGNAIRRLSPNATQWQYEDQSEVHLDADGNVITNPVPALQDVYRGELIVQGLVAAKGRIITEQAGGHTGVLGVYWNSEAVRDVANTALSVHDPLVRRISWTHDDTINVDNLWQEKTDSGLPASSVPTPPQP